MLQLNIKESKALEIGINVHGLLAGTIVLAVTKNNLYKLIKCKEKHYVIAQGGKYLIEPTEIVFSGSTFGVSMIKVGWIGCGMFMEMFIPSQRKKIKTSAVRAARVIGNGWEYDMDWEKIKTADIKKASI